MRNRNAGIDEFKLARVFGAIAAAIALYGMLLVVMTLLDAPLETSATRFTSFTATAVAAESEPDAKAPTGRGVPFWRSHEVPADPPRTGQPAQDVDGVSFWRVPGAASDRTQLADAL